jgi:hypothetical protein
VTRREWKLLVAGIVVVLLLAVVNAIAVTAGWYCTCGGAS